MSKTYAFVFVRGGSKGLPNKNILPLRGIPMLAHSINIGLALEDIDRVFVSTESSQIASIAIQYGAEVIDRPSMLASDTSSEWLAWQHAIRSVNESLGSFDRFLSLPATSPLRNENDVQSCLNALQEGIDMVVTMTPSRRSPWFNMVTCNESGEVKLLAKEGNYVRRQDCIRSYDLTTVAYVSRPDFILQSSGLWQGVVTGVEIPSNRAVDIDTQLDYDFARFLMDTQ